MAHNARGLRPGRRFNLFRARHVGAERKNDCACASCGAGPGRRATEEILDYCATDMDALERLLPAMLPRIDLPRALLRGRYMAAAAAMEWNGVPIDTARLELLREHWTDIQDDLIAAIDADYGVFDGRTFKRDRLRNLPDTARHSVAAAGERPSGFELTTRSGRWPRLPSRSRRCASCAARCPRCGSTIWRLDSDGRNRTILSAFRSRTGRNQPSNTRYIFGPVYGCAD